MTSSFTLIATSKNHRNEKDFHSLHYERLAEEFKEVAAVKHSARLERHAQPSLLYFLLTFNEGELLDNGIGLFAVIHDAIVDLARILHVIIT